MPCLNEAETLRTCIEKAQQYLARSGVRGEILVADNGSTDGSQQIATEMGGRVVDVSLRGYGSALRGGIEAASGTYIIMADSDDSYDFMGLDNFIDKLREGYDLVMGNRFQGGIAKDAMPPLHKYLGNPILSSIGRMFFSLNVGDFHCGMRGFNRASILKLDLCSTGMEFASEMVVKAALARLRITEIPTTLNKAGRSRPPHLRSWQDGWRHLRFLLMYSPRWLFLYPGLFLTCFGIAIMALVLPGPLRVGPVTLDVHTLLIGSSAIILGTQIILFFMLAKQHAINCGLLPEGLKFRTFRQIVSLDSMIILGVLMLIGGLCGVSWAVLEWANKSFGELDYGRMMRLIVPSATFLVVGVQVVMSGFLSGILDLKISR